MLKEIYFIRVYSAGGNFVADTEEQDTFPTHEELAAAIKENQGYSSKIDKRFKLA